MSVSMKDVAESIGPKLGFYISVVSTTGFTKLLFSASTVTYLVPHRYN